MTTQTMNKKNNFKSFQQIPIEQVQNYWNNRPCNIRHSTKPIGTKEYFEEVRDRKYFVEPHLPMFANFNQYQSKDVLEIGCGIGTATISFAQAGANITGVDLSEKSLQLAKKRAEIFHLKDNVQFFHGNCENLSKIINPKQYDLIFSFGVIHHSPHPEKILQEAYHFLKPNGEIKVMVYHLRSWKVLKIVLGYGKCQFWKWRKLIAQYSEAQSGCPITYAYTKKSVKQLFEKQGYIIDTIEVDHIFPYKIKDYINYRYKKVWYFRWMPKKWFRWLEKCFGWHLCITARKQVF